MKKIFIILAIILIGTGIVFAAPPAYQSYVGTILPVGGDNVNDIGTSTNEFRNLYMQGNLINSSGKIGIGTTSPYAQLSVEGSSALGNSATAGYFVATTTNATSTFAGNLMIGNSMFNGQLDISSLGTGVAQFQVSTSTNDFAKVAFGNMSAGTASMFCNIYNNGRSTRAGVSSAYYGGLCFAGHNYNTAGFDGIKPNGFAVFASDGDVSIGSASSNAASSSIRFFVGGTGAAFSAAGQDAILQGGTGNFGLATTSPWGKLSVTQTGTAPILVWQDEANDATPGMIDNDGNMFIHQSAKRYPNAYGLEVTGPLVSGAEDQGIAIFVAAPTSSTSGRAFSTNVIGQAFSSGMFYGNGVYGIGPGTATRDVFLGRSVANTLRIGSLYDLSGTADLIVNDQISAGSTTPRATLSIEHPSLSTRPSMLVSTSTASATTTVLSVDKDGVMNTKYGIYCEMYGNNAMVTTSIPTGTTYTQINAFGSTTQALSTKYCTPNPSTSKITITNPGRYRGTVSVSFSGTANIDWRGALFVGGTEQDNIHFQRKLGATDDVGSASASGYFTATSSSVVDFRVRHTDVGSDNFTLHYGNINVEYVGN